MPLTGYDLRDLICSAFETAVASGLETGSVPVAEFAAQSRYPCYPMSRGDFSKLLLLVAHRRQVNKKFLD